MSSNPAIQDFYPDDFAHCYGCGRLNADGLHVQSRGDGDDMVAHYTPRAAEVAVPGFVYGGLIASLIDCHAMGTASAAVERAAGRDIGAGPAPRFVTASLKLDFLKPTPHGPELEIRGRAREIGERKVIVDATLSANGVVTARAEVVAVRMPESMGAQATGTAPAKRRPSAPSQPQEVFLYGLFMDVGMLREKGFNPGNVRTGWVAELGLKIGQRAALVAETGSRVHGLVMTLTQAELDRLYGEPGVREYKPQDVMVHLEDTSMIPAVCYNLPDGQAPGEKNPEYVAKLKALAEAIGLPADYIATLT